MRTFFIIIFLFIAHFAFSQKVLEGLVLDNLTKEPLSGATIFAGSLGTVTSINGQFTLHLANNTDTLIVSYIGYETKKIKAETTPLIIALVPLSVNVQEIVVSASREQQQRSEVPIAISKISSRLMESTKPTLLTEIINKVPGVFMLNLNNEQHAMSIRLPMGYNAYFLYLENGIPLRPPGIFNHNALIEENIMGIKSIEVVKGPSSSLYGSEAIGGAVNFITLAPTSIPTGRIGIQFDNFGYKRIQFNSGFYVNKKLGFSLGGFYSSQINSWQTYSDYHKFSINLRSDYSINETTKVVIAATNNDYFSETGGNADSTGFYSRKYLTSQTFSYRTVNALRARLTLQKSWNDSMESFLTFFYRKNAIGQLPNYSFRMDKEQSNKAHNEINNNSFNSYGVIAQNSKNLTLLNAKLMVGASLDYSPNTYNAYYIEVDRDTVSGQFTSYHEKKDSLLTDYKAYLLNTGLYAQLELSPFKNARFVMGLRYDRLDYKFDNHLTPSSYSGAHDEKNGFNNLIPKIGITYKIDNWKGLYANYSRGFSPPGINQLYRGVTVPQLKPAIFDNYEIGGWFTLMKNKLKGDVSIYQMNGFNEIVTYILSNNSTEYRNSGKTVHRGIEYGINFTPNREIFIRIGGTNAFHKFIKYQVSSELNYNQKEMPNAPHWILNGEITYRPHFIKNLRFTLEYQRVSSYFKGPDNLTKYNDKTLFGARGISILNLRAGYVLKGFEVYTNVLNVTNELYANMVTTGRYAFTPAAPRVYTLGINYNFNWRK